MIWNTSTGTEIISYYTHSDFDLMLWIFKINVFNVKLLDRAMQPPIAVPIIGQSLAAANDEDICVGPGSELKLFNVSYSMLHATSIETVLDTWGHCCQNQVSKAWIRNYIPHNIVHVFTMPQMPISDNKGFIYTLRSLHLISHEFAWNELLDK